MVDNLKNYKSILGKCVKLLVWIEKSKITKVQGQFHYEPESLSAVSSYESDTEGDGFSKLFGRLGRYRRENKEQHLHRVRKK